MLLTPGSETAPVSNEETHTEAPSTGTTEEPAVTTGSETHNRNCTCSK